MHRKANVPKQPRGPDPRTVNFLSVCAELLAHPDYQYLVKHGGEPSLSLLGGPEHDISAANLWKKLMNKWAAEGEAAEGTGPHAQTLAQTLHSGTPTAAAKRSSLDQLMGKWAADVQARLADTSTPSPDSSSTLQVLPGSAVGPAGGLEQPLAEPTASVMALPGSSAATDGTRPAAAASSRHYLAAAPPVRSLIAAAAAGAGGTFAQLEPRSASDAWLQPKELRTPLPSEDAVKMANIGSDSVPGMSPAEYREALYHTWGTGQPAGMQYMASDSDDEVRAAFILGFAPLLDSAPWAAWVLHSIDKPCLRCEAVVIQVGMQSVVNDCDIEPKALASLYPVH